MAQSPHLLLMDEPTSFLDIGHEIQILGLVKKWQQECELTIVMVLHDLNLAAQFCDRLVLLSEGAIYRSGEPWDVLQKDILGHVYGADAEVVKHPILGLPQVLLNGRGVW